MSLAEWRSRHARQLNAPERDDAQVIFLGDSITEGWSNARSFRKQFRPYRPLNLGIGGDQTQHLLWRIHDGALDGLRPKAVVVMIGVNNLGDGFSPDETVAGIKAILGAVRSRLRGVPILLLKILPAGQSANDPLRKMIVETNRSLDALDEPARVNVVEVGTPLVEPDGSIARTTMADFLHPTNAGYRTLTEAVAPHIASLLKGRPVRKPTGPTGK
jgi:lysophospholipase L1-like esterase